MDDKVFEIRILKINVLSFSFIGKESLENPNIDENEINYKYKSNIGLKVNPNDEIIDIKISLKVFLPKKKNEIINLEVLSSYHFKDLKSFIVEENEVELPEDLMKNLILTSLANTRGVLAVNVSESGFKNIILPLIQMNELKPKK